MLPIDRNLDSYIGRLTLNIVWHKPSLFWNGKNGNATKMKKIMRQTKEGGSDVNYVNVLQDLVSMYVYVGSRVHRVIRWL